MTRTYTRAPLAERFWAKVNRQDDGCWLWTASLDSTGYGVLHDGGWHGAKLLSHRVSWELHVGPIPPGMFVCHRCDVKHCVRPDHLFLGSAGDNANDRAQKGRSLSRWGAYLTPEQVETIRADRAAGMSYRTIGKLNGMSHTHIRRICLGQTYR